MFPEIIPEGEVIEVGNDFRLVHIGEKTWVLFYKATADYQISLTGSSTNYDAQIPFNFRIEYIIICADDATSKDIDVYVMPIVASQLTYPPRILNKSSDTVTDRLVEYGRPYKFPTHGVIRFTLNGTATKKIFVLACLQRLGK